MDIIDKVHSQPGKCKLVFSNAVWHALNDIYYMLFWLKINAKYYLCGIYLLSRISTFNSE